MMIFKPHLGGANNNDVHACEKNYMTMQNKIIAKKILSVYKCTALKIVVNPSFDGWVVVFLIIIFCSAVKRSVRRHGFIVVPPHGRGANSSQNCCPRSFCSHKQRCLTVLSEL